MIEDFGFLRDDLYKKSLDISYQCSVSACFLSLKFDGQNCLHRF